MMHLTWAVWWPVPAAVPPLAAFVAWWGDRCAVWTLPWWLFPSEWRRQGGRWARLEETWGGEDGDTGVLLASVPSEGIACQFGTHLGCPGAACMCECHDQEPGLEYADELQVIRGELMADDAEREDPAGYVCEAERAAWHAADPLEQVRDDPQVVLWDIRQQVARISDIRVQLAQLAAEVASPEYWARAA